MVLLEETNRPLPGRPFFLFWYCADGMKPGTEHGGLGLPQPSKTNLDVNLAETSSLFSKVQEGSVI